MQCLSPQASPLAQEEGVEKSRRMISPTKTCVTLVSRRTMLRQLGAAGLLLALWPTSAWTTPEAVQQAIRQRIGDREPQPGGMTLTLPKLAETGNSVPLTVSVESPMTPVDHVLRIHVFVPGNPESVAATYHLGERAGKAQISTHIRLARTQTVLALAEMSDGSVRSDAASVLVTLGACVDELWSE
jgi:sulfur-oxidizing protein SoxY